MMPLMTAQTLFFANISTFFKYPNRNMLTFKIISEKLRFKTLTVLFIRFAAMIPSLLLLMATINSSAKTLWKYSTHTIKDWKEDGFTLTFIIIFKKSLCFSDIQRIILLKSKNQFLLENLTRNGILIFAAFPPNFLRQPPHKILRMMRVNISRWPRMSLCFYL